MAGVDQTPPVPPSAPPFSDQPWVGRGQPAPGWPEAASRAVPGALVVDDRLDTVLRTRAAGAAAMRVQFRQLADLLGVVADAAWGEVHEAGLARLDDLLDAIMAEAAQAAARVRDTRLGEGAVPDPGLAVQTLLATTPLRTPRLVARLARREPRLALAALTAARLDVAQWLELIPALPIPARGLLRHRRDLGAAVEALLERLGVDDLALTGPVVVEPLPMAVQPEPAPAPMPDEVPDPAPVLAASELEPDPEPSASAAAQLAADDAAAGAITPEPIGAIVRRIAEFRRIRDERAAMADHGASPPAPAPEAPPASAPVPSTVPATAISPDAAQAGTVGHIPFADEPAHAPLPTQLTVVIDLAGVIVGADSHAPLLVGHQPFTVDPSAPARCDPLTLRAFRARIPLERGLITLEGAPAIAGAWRIDAAPAFDAATGAFGGYTAALRRPERHALPAAAVAARDDSADRLRQLLHELRTPINAIQGFAELIQQQVLGPAPHQYRSLAASVTADAARMLAGFDDLERLARLEAGEPLASAEPAPSLVGAHAGTPPIEAPSPASVDAVDLLARLVRQLQPVIGPREVRLACHAPDTALAVGWPPLELERTLWRLLAVIGGAAAPGDNLVLSIAPHAARPGFARLDLPLPSLLAQREDAALFAPDGQRPAHAGTNGAAPHAGFGSGGFGGGGVLGSGFALRLARAEIAAGGGQLIRDGARLLIDLPLAPEQADADEHAEVGGAGAKAAG